MMFAKATFPVILCSLGVIEIARADDPKKWCFDWARSYGVSGLEARFTSRKLPHGASTERQPVGNSEFQRGLWRFTLLPFCRQYLETEKVLAGKIAYTRKASWDDETGEGRSFLRKSDRELGSGGISLSRPGILGKADLPNNASFFFRRGRSLSRFWESEKTEVRELEPDRFAFYCMGTYLIVFLLDRKQGFPIVEQRVYMKPDVPVPEELRHLPFKKDLGREIELPDEYRGGAFLINNVVLETREIDGYWLPIRWKVLHSAGTEEFAVIELDPESIRVNPNLESEDYGLTFSPGTGVHDSSRGIGYSVGSAGEAVNAEVLAEATLDAILEDAGLEKRANSADRAESRATGCGANVLYAALSILGKPAPFTRILEGLGIREGIGDCAFADIIRVAADCGEQAIAVRGGKGLLEIAAVAPMILHHSPSEHGGAEAVTSEGMDHFYIITGYDSGTGTVLIIDPPLKAYRATVDMVAGEWSGNAVIFTEKGIEAFEALKWRRMLGNILGVSAAIIGLALLAGMLRRRRKA